MFCLFSASVFSALAYCQNAVIFVPNITTGAGNGTAGFTGDNGLATAAELDGPGNVAYDTSGNLYIADTLNDVIRKVTPSGIISTVAGMAGVAGFSGDGGSATSAELSGPNGLAIDSAGNLYIADTNNARIREVSVATGNISTIAGNGTKAVYTANGPALTSPLDGPNSIALDSAGNVYIADSTSNRCLELVVGSQQLILFAGSSNSGGVPAGDNGPATAAKFSGPRAVAADNAGNIYLVDKAHSDVRKVNIASGIITTVAGNATAGFMGDGGLATAAELSGPTGAFVDGSGNLYIVDTANERLRFVNASTGIISTIAGNGTAGYSGDGSAATASELNTPSGVSISSVSGQIAIADTTNNVVRLINGLTGSFRTTPVGASSTSQNISAVTTASVTLQTYQINPAASADFTMGAVTGCNLPGTLSAGTTCTGAVTFNPKYPGLRISQVIAKDSANNQYTFPLVGIGTAPAVGLGPGITTSYAGTGTAGSAGDGGPAASALLNGSLGISLDAAGNLYIADTSNNKVRVVSAGGNISTIAGTGNAGFSGNGGAAIAATLSAPSGVAVDPSGNIYIADTANSVIRQVSVLNQNIGSFAGTGGTPGYSGDGGAAASATLKNPKGVASDQSGNIYIADTGNGVIREVSSGNISTLVGAIAGLSAPAGVAIDASGNLYIADTGNNEVRKLSNGTLTVIAGTGTAGYSGDGGPATSARISAPTAVSIDAAGNVYITDSGNNRVRFISSSSNSISTVAGTGTAGNAGNGGGATSSQLTTPSGISIDQLGRFYIADTGNNRVQKVDSTSVALSFGSVNVGTPSVAQTAILTNIGNTQLMLSSLAIPAGFMQTPSGGTDCSSTTTLAAGAQCLISLIFQPTAKQTYTGSIVITDNALNSTTSTQSIALNGIGTVPSTPTTITIQAGNNQTGPPLAAFANQLKVLVTDQNGVAISNVAVSFTAPAAGATGTFTGGNNVATVTTDSTGTATAPVLTASSTRGTFSVTAAVVVIPKPATFTETIAGNPAPQLMVTISPTTNPQTYGNPVQLNVTLAPSTFNGNTPTGTITFLDAGQLIGTAMVNGATATTTIYPSATTTATPHMLSASYSGDSNFSASTTSNTVNLSVNPLAITATATSISVAYDPSAAPVPTATLTGTLNGVIAADQGKVTATFTSAGLKFASSPSGTAVSGTNVVGTYPITATLGGGAAANYVLTGTTGQVSITKAGTVATLSSSSTTPAFGSTVTLTATLTPMTTGIPTGLVSFYYGTSLLGTATAANGAATFSTASLPLGLDSITAVYAGDTNFTGTTSPALTLAVAVPGFTLSAATTSVSVQQGNIAYVPLTLSTVGGFAGTITLSCSGLPANAACVFVPAVFTSTATATSASGIVQIVTSGPGSVIGSNSRPAKNYSLAAISLLPGFLLMVAFGARRGRVKPLTAICLLAGGLILCMSPIGCGGSSSNPATTVATPAGTSAVTISATSGTVTSTATVMLTVTQVR